MAKKPSDSETKLKKKVGKALGADKASKKPAKKSAKAASPAKGKAQPAPAAAATVTPPPAKAVAAKKAPPKTAAPAKKAQAASRGAVRTRSGPAEADAYQLPGGLIYGELDVNGGVLTLRPYDRQFKPFVLEDSAGPTGNDLVLVIKLRADGASVKDAKLLPALASFLQKYADGAIGGGSTCCRKDPKVK